jgi:hypothetical protein
MAKKYSSVWPKITSPFAPEKQQSNAASIPHVYRELCLAFPVASIFSATSQKRPSGCHSWRLTLG